MDAQQLTAHSFVTILFTELHRASIHIRRRWPDSNWGANPSPDSIGELQILIAAFSGVLGELIVTLLRGNQIRVLLHS